MSKPVIAVDIDNVLAQSAQSFVEFCNQNFGTHMTVDDYQEDFALMWGVSHEEAVRRASVMTDNNIHRHYQVIPGAQQVLTSLKPNYCLIAVTSRRRVTETNTRNWLAKHYPNIFEDIVFAGFWDDATVRDGHLRHKGDIYQQIKADYTIDDQLKHCQAAAADGVKAVLYGDYPWNQADKLPTGLVRVLDWSAVERYFDEQS